MLLVDRKRTVGGKEVITSCLSKESGYKSRIETTGYKRIVRGSRRR